MGIDMGRILNFGSFNIDEVYSVSQFVKPGETAFARKVERFPGGKGLNQSIAAARAGAQIWHAGKIGQDGGFLRDLLVENGVHVEFVRQTQGFNGRAVIQVDEKGENCILLYQGANYEMTQGFISETLAHFGSGDLLMLQNEVNLLPVLVREAKKKGMLVALNPSPMTEDIFSCGLEQVDFLLINEVEGEALSGESEPEKILEALHFRYPGCRLILTLGGDGSLYLGPEGRFEQAIFPVKAVDTTAAGDTFAGYFLTCCLTGMPVPRCLELSSRAAALAVSKMGASVSIPVMSQVLEWEEQENKK